GGRESREGERGVASARRDVEHAQRAPLAPPAKQLLEIVARRMTSTRHVGVSDTPELRLDPGLVLVGHAGFIFGRWARWRTKKSSSRGERSKRRLACWTSFTRSAPGYSRSCSSIHAMACLTGASPAAMFLGSHLPCSRSCWVCHPLFTS